MDEKQKEETIEVFAEAFHEVVVPVLEGLASKTDLAEVKEDIAEVKRRLNTLDDKVEIISRTLIKVTDH